MGPMCLHINLAPVKARWCPWTVKVTVYRSVVSLAVCHRLIGLSIYTFPVYERELSTPLMYVCRVWHIWPSNLVLAILWRDSVSICRSFYGSRNSKVESGPEFCDPHTGAKVVYESIETREWKEGGKKLCAAAKRKTSKTFFHPRRCAVHAV